MRGYDWDDEVQDEIAEKIGDWLEQLKSLQEVVPGVYGVQSLSSRSAL